MRLIFAEQCRRFHRHQRYLPFYVLLFFAVGSAGCNNTCFTFISNPPTGTIGIQTGDPPLACTLPKAPGVRLELQTVPICTLCPESSRIQHLVVSIQGVDVREGLTPDDNSPDWQELTPQLATRPLQVDLVGGIVDQGARKPLGDIVAIPAGIYRQVRVRFLRGPVADHPPRTNACGSAGLNCIAMADGVVQPLLFDSDSPELLIPSERIAGGALHVFPHIDSDLVIEMTPVWSWVSLNRDIRLAPALTANARVEHVDSDELGTPVSEVAYRPTSK